MKVKRITDFEGFQKIKNKWNEMIFSSGQSCIFFTHEWFHTWWKCFKEDNLLEILVFEDENGSLFGIAPLIVKDRSLRFIASQEVSDYCDFVSLRERREEFYESLLSYIQMNYSNRGKIELVNVKSSSPTLSFLPKLAPKYNFSCSYFEKEVAPFLELPSSYQDYIDSLSRKNRHELQRKLRRMKSLEGVRTRKITDSKELQYSIGDFITLHKESSSSKEKFWEKENMPDFFKEITHKFSLNGWAELNFLYARDKLLAALLTFSYMDEIYFYNIAYNNEFSWYSPGFFLFNLSIKQAILEKKKKADFLRGGEKYKYYFGAKESKIYNLTLMSKGY